MGELKRVGSRWQKDLEINKPEGVATESELVEFFKQKEAQIKLIEQFISILNDWINETVAEVENMEEAKPTEKPAPMKRITALNLDKAALESQARFRAQQQAQDMVQAKKRESAQIEAAENEDLMK